MQSRFFERCSSIQIFNPHFTCPYTLEFSCRYHLFTPWSRVFLLKLTGTQLVNKFTANYGTRWFIVAFTTARHLSLSLGRSIQSIPPHPTSLRSILILSFHLRLGLPSGLFPSGFPNQNPVYASPLPYTGCMPLPSDSSRYDHPNNTG